MRDGKIVHISEVDSGKHIDCTCPGCGAVVVAKKGVIVEHHFAHEHETHCSIDSILRNVARAIIQQRIIAGLALCKPIPISWRCDLCGDQHGGNLIKKAQRVANEECLEGVTPAILLLGADAKPLVAIEVIVAQLSDARATHFYQQNKIALLVIKIESEVDIDRLRTEETLVAASGTACTRQKCGACHQPLMPSPIHVVTGDCYKCHSPMKVSFRDSNEGTSGPETFSEAESRRARAAGCILQMRYSSVTNTRYLANVCEHCKAFTGSFYLYEYTPLADRLSRRDDQIYCPRCDKYFDGT